MFISKTFLFYFYLSKCSHWHLTGTKTKTSGSQTKAKTICKLPICLLVSMPMSTSFSLWSLREA